MRLLRRTRPSSCPHPSTLFPGGTPFLQGRHQSSWPPSCTHALLQEPGALRPSPGGESALTLLPAEPSANGTPQEEGGTWPGLQVSIQGCTQQAGSHGEGLQRELLRARRAHGPQWGGPASTPLPSRRRQKGRRRNRWRHRHRRAGRAGARLTHLGVRARAAR